MRPRTAHSRRLLAAAATALAVVLAAQPGAQAGLAMPPRRLPSAPAPAAGSGEVHRVTLVTGDIAELEVRPDGTERARPAAGSGSGYHAFVSDGDAYLVPARAQPLLGRNRLDLALFNVSELVEQGYDDAHADHIPLILGYGTGHRLSATRTPVGATRSAVLGSVNAVAVEAGKKDATRFWDEVAGTAGARLTGRVDKIWLDTAVHSTLDESAAQIGAPAAWSRGLTGKGTRIAVLDTGIDDTHPDFAGRIAATRDFTGTGTVHDGAGHGTHVASIAAGTGAASSGSYRGIASDAALMVGKVLDDNGQGSSSDIIAGMEWAAANGADVVNLSLGGPVTRGDDPMSQAVDRLTAQYDALFVIAAGNYSPWVPGMEFVTAPGAAGSALTVGATQGADAVYGGSRRGRMDSAAIKPEIVAPGYNITAAGSSYAGLPQYVGATGTSMATPHIAGAAAVLKQQHPDWDAEQLRDALTSTATPLEYHDVHQRGSGRTDLDRATAQQVYVDAGTLYLGYFARPFQPGELTATRTLTYRNTSAAAVTLDLATTLEGRRDGPADGALKVEPASLTVPAGGTAQAEVSLDATDVPADAYSGRVTARAGDVELGTAVAFYKQDDTVDVTIRAIDRDGAPGSATVRISPYKERDGRYYPDYIYLDAQQPEYTVRLPEGDYNLWSLVTTWDASGRYAEEQSIVGDPKLEVRAPNPTVTIDARKAVPITLETPRTSQPRSVALGWWRGDDDSAFFTEDTWGWSFIDGSPEKVSVTPTERVDDAPFVFSASWDSGVDPLVATWRGQRLDAEQVGGPVFDGRHVLPVTDIGEAEPAGLPGRSLDGRIALIRESATASYSDQVQAAADAGAELAILYSAQPGVFWPRTADGPIPVLTLPRQQGEMLRSATSKQSELVHLLATPRTPYAYDVSATESGQVPAQLGYRPRQQDLAEVTTNIYTTGTEERGWRLHQTALDSCGCGPSVVDDFVPSTGYTRTEYVTARPDLKTASAWQFVFGLPADVLYNRATTGYRPGQEVTENWLKAPLSPGLAQSEIKVGGASHTVKRSGSWLSYGLAGFTDSDGHWLPNFSVMSESSRLYRDGQQVFATNGLMGGLNVPDDPATYRLEADVSHDGRWLGLSTSSRTAWTFRSGTTENATMLPLIDVDYAGVVDAYSGRDALDLANTAPGDRLVRLALNTAHQDGSQAAPVQQVRVRVSYDDGATWSDTSVKALGGERFGATYRHPQASASTGYVSLQVDATDADGNKLEQTLTRAYRLR